MREQVSKSVGDMRTELLPYVKPTAFRSQKSGKQVLKMGGKGRPEPVREYGDGYLKGSTGTEGGVGNRFNHLF